nr:Probable NreB protein [Kibdelosporangium sp. MJ126-NF4]CTQ99109.1 Probable NreB protein [Kibdelosporangium sp. MJ126-NF4]
MLVLAAITLGGVLQARATWPANDVETLEHVHDDLDDGHPHLHDAISPPNKAGATSTPTSGSSIHRSVRPSE